MIRGLHTAAAGMVAQQQNIDVISNNIANVNTYAFKQDRAEFQDLMYQSLNYTAGATSETTTNPTGIDTGLGVRLSNIQKNFLQGSLIETGNTYDIAITGNGFFQVETPSGDIAYTRNGAFKPIADGGGTHVLTDGNGNKLVPNVVVDKTAVSVSIAADGTVTSYDSSGVQTGVQNLEIVSFANPAGLAPQGNSLYLETEVSGAPQLDTPGLNGLGTLEQGKLEGSNVQLVTEMVNLITAQRGYEANSKSINTTDSMLQTVNALKR